MKSRVITLPPIIVIAYDIVIVTVKHRKVRFVRYFRNIDSFCFIIYQFWYSPLEKGGFSFPYCIAPTCCYVLHIIRR